MKCFYKTEYEIWATFLPVGRDVHICPVHLVHKNLISILVTDYILKRSGQALLFSFEYNLLPKLISI